MNDDDKPQQYRDSSLRGWIEGPRADRGMLVLDGPDFEFHSYEKIAAAVRRCSGSIARELPSRAKVALSAGDPVQFVATFVGLCEADCIPIPVPPLEHFPDVAAYGRHIEQIATSVGLEAIVGDEIPSVLSDLGDIRVGALNGREGAIRWATFPSRSSQSPSAPDAIASDVLYLQLTSGSTDAPKGVMVTVGNVLAQFAMQQEWLQLDDSDAVATWLPFHHDMGLGSVLMPLWRQANVVALRPSQFVRRPRRWLEGLASTRGTITAAPPFGYTAIQRVPGDWELSGWRAAICGAQIVSPDVVRAFEGKWQSAGVARGTFCPAYGMAEATLAVSGARPQAGARIAVIGEPAVFETRLSNVEVKSFDDPGTVAGIVSSGQPMSGLAIEVRLDSGAKGEDGTIGELWIRGPNVARGYVGAPSEAAFCDGWFGTGDAGFMLEGEVFVLGRIADRVKVRGRIVSAELLERRIERVLGLRDGSTLAVPSLSLDGQGINLIIETRGVLNERTERAARAELRLAVGTDCSIAVLGVTPGWIRRTTSGKPQRREAWRILAGYPSIGGKG